MALNYLFYVFFFGSLVFFTLFVLTWIVFGRLIRLQIKRWILASRGYVEVEHISPTNVRNYFILRPKDSKFDISGGFYHYIPETITRKGAIMTSINKDLLNNSEPNINPDELSLLNEHDREEYKRKLTAEWNELRNLAKVINKMNYDPELLTRKMGMPVITYYGDNPDPVNFSDRKKVYGSGVIKDMYLRLLLTQRYKDFKLFILISVIAFVIIAGATAGLYSVNSSSVKNYAKCVQIFNESNNRYLDILNQSIQSNIQNQGQPIPI